jgi:hypothetical protein
MVGCGSDQGRSEVETRRRSLESEAGVAALRRGFRPSENADLGHKMPFMDGHWLGVTLTCFHVGSSNSSKTSRIIDEYAAGCNPMLDLMGAEAAPMCGILNH